MTATAWVGGPVLEAVVDDGTGALPLPFLGRRRVGGVEVGRRLTAAGTVVRHTGRMLLMNPLLWLASDEAVCDVILSSRATSRNRHRWAVSVVGDHSSSIERGSVKMTR